jgi:outer membrane immunogenic protein
MKKIISGSTIARSALFAAADLPTQQAYRSTPVVAPVYDWTGIYVGANAGYGSGKQDPLGLLSNDFAAFN